MKNNQKQLPNSADFIKIKGGKPVSGEITVYGAKNSVSKILVAALLTEETCTLRNVSYVVDTELMINVLQALGAKVENNPEERVIKITAKKIHDMDDAKFQEVVGKSRVPILLCGPLLARLGHAMIPALGGCVIGNRPVDFHVAALRKLGAQVEEKTDGIYFRTETLRGQHIKLEYPSVGATEQVILSSVLSVGTTTLSNAAIEPEILDLVEALGQMGAEIVLEDRTFTITGVNKLSGFDHTAIPDRLEIASWACTALATNGKVHLKNARAEHLSAFLEKYTEVGGAYSTQEDGITFWKKQGPLKPTNIETNVYPGFATDWQQPFVVVLTQAQGESVVHETVYEQRFGYTEALVKMGANIRLEKGCHGVLCRYNNEYLHTAFVTGPSSLKAAEIEVPDLRGGFSYVIAAMVAEGTSTIRNISLLKRGYENFIEKLNSIGVVLEE